MSSIVTMNIENIEVNFDVQREYARRWIGSKIKNGIHEPALVKALLKTFKGLEEEFCFFDIGANLGFFSSILAAAGVKEIHTFELNEFLIPMIEANLKLNNWNQTKTYINHCGVADKNRLGYYSLNELRYAITKLNYSKEESDIYSLPVNVLSIDDYLSNKDIKNIIMKIDVEGAESHVLLGMKQLLSSNKRVKVFIEIHPRFLLQQNINIEDTFDYLQTLGLKLSIFNHKGEQFSMEPINSCPNIDSIYMLYIEN